MEFQPKQHLFVGGQIPRSLYFVESGMLESYVNEDSGRRYSAFWSAGSIIYYHTNIWNRAIADESLIAQRFSIVHSLPYESLFEIHKLFSEFNYHIAGFLERMNLELERRIRILSMKYTDGRVSKFMEYYGQIAYDIPVTHLAQFLCMSESTYYAILKQQKRLKK
ncbi:hypothetical protein GCM10011511_11690 [Puia dinghuensis]|uniref:Cyclic nucleotide-binding domain-containing protein n=2 Tax=Puia dinghuensis TaxID=1792502 RepID=A0A8J2UA88_9BACT|nr:hypothetical protein GCM10011511_11690 [Puia dinghuensis]